MKIKITDATVANGAVRDIGEVVEVDVEEAAAIVGVGRGVAVTDEASDQASTDDNAKAAQAK
jgi:hypothetical protein